MPPAFDADEPPRELAKVLEFVAPRDAEPDAEFAGPLRPMEDDGPRLAADAAEPLLNPRAEFAPDAPKRALEGGATPARLPAL